MKLLVTGGAGYIGALTVRRLREAGDPDGLVASSARARGVLGWKARHPDLEAILETAWRFARAQPRGYAS